MVTKAHGHSTVHWIGNVCISILDGAFNQEGAADWVEQLQQTWMQQGQPTPWLMWWIWMAGSAVLRNQPN